MTASRASPTGWRAISSEAITIEALADRAAMSVRTFTRRFRAATGTAPIEWLIRLRVRRAQDLLETTDAPIDHDRARVAGFGAPETLRHHFRKVVGTSPSAWRNSFRGKATGRKTKPAPQGRRFKSACLEADQELALSTVTERRFCDQHEMSLHTATGRSLP